MSLASAIASSSDADLVDRGDRAEELLVVGVVVGGHVGEHGGGEEVAVALTPADDARAAGDGTVELLLQPLGGVVRGERPEHGVLGRRVARLRPGERGGELLQELVVELVDDDEPLGGVAGLAAVVQPRRHRGIDRRIQVVGVQQDERVGPAELQHHLLQVASRDLGDGGAGALGTGQRDALHPRVGDADATCSLVA